MPRQLRALIQVQGHPLGLLHLLQVRWGQASDLHVEFSWALCSQENADHVAVVVLPCSVLSLVLKCFCACLSLVLVAEVLPEVCTSQHFPGDRIAELEVDDTVLVEAVEARELLALDAGRVEVTEEWLVLWLSSSEWTVHRYFGMLALKPPASRVVQGVMHQEGGLKPVKTLIFALDIVLGADAKVVVEDHELIHPIVTLLRHTRSGSFFCKNFL